MASSTVDVSVSPSEASTVAPCPAGDAASALATWKGYVMFIGLAIVAYGVARGSLAVRHVIYQDKVRLETFYQSRVRKRKIRGR